MRKATGTGAQVDPAPPLPDLYFRKSTKRVRELELLAADRLGFWNRRSVGLDPDPSQHDYRS
ncbi:MAG: hypothetical protein RMM30_04320 [Armatimonadota bacterium]|nr:hypothetical protein [Armatimonadota bacterium]MDW8155793.1 hypothetical protein [Armatimonadota bacterium]